ncbi:MAG: HAD-IA family hydrolase [Clostridia bacterium]|nr:HAD-IA family hydrolase [Clostridia bacterium]
MDKKLLIFDLDGTLLNTLQDLCDAVNHTLVHFGYEMRSDRFLRMCWGNGYVAALKKALQIEIPNARFEEILQYFIGYYAKHCADKTAPYPGVLEMLEKLKTVGYTLTVVSNKANEEACKLTKKYFGALIDITVGAREEIRKKPYPDTVFEVLAQTGYRQSQAVFIGDTEVDIETAKNAEMPCVCVKWGFRTEEQLVAAGATLLVDTAESLYQRVLSL